MRGRGARAIRGTTTRFACSSSGRSRVRMVFRFLLLRSSGIAPRANGPSWVSCLCLNSRRGVLSARNALAIHGAQHLLLNLISLYLGCFGSLGPTGRGQQHGQFKFACGDSRKEARRKSRFCAAIGITCISRKSVFLSLRCSLAEALCPKVIPAMLSLDEMRELIQWDVPPVLILVVFLLSCNTAVRHARESWTVLDTTIRTWCRVVKIVLS